MLLESDAGTSNTKRLNAPKTSKMGTIPIPFANKMKKNNVRTNGVQVMTHFGPTFGLTMESRMNWTMASIPFIHPDGAVLLLDKNFLTGIITAIPTNKATIHNMKTCLVTDMEYDKGGAIYQNWKHGG